MYSLFTVRLQASPFHFVESYAILLLPINLLMLERFAALFQLADLKFKSLKK